MPRTLIPPSMNPSLAPADLPLRDIHLPTEIGYWPLAPGWWLLLGLVFSFCLGVFLLMRFRRRRYLRKVALSQLDSLQNLGGSELAAALSRLLRQAAISHFPPHEVAGLSGEAWLEFLDRPLPGQPFTAGVGRTLCSAPYQPVAEIQVPELLDLCRNWLQKLPPRTLPGVVLFWRGR